MRYISLFFIGIFISSCSLFLSDEYKKELVNIDRVEIRLNNSFSLSFKGREDINILTNMIKNEKPENYKCPSDGELLFYKKDKLALKDVEFSLKEKCQYIKFTYKNEVNYRKISKEGIIFLKKYI